MSTHARGAAPSTQRVTNSDSAVTLKCNKSAEPPPGGTRCTPCKGSTTPRTSAATRGLTTSSHKQGAISARLNTALLGSPSPVRKNSAPAGTVASFIVEEKGVPRRKISAPVRSTQGSNAASVIARVPKRKTPPAAASTPHPSKSFTPSLTRMSKESGGGTATTSSVSSSGPPPCKSSEGQHLPTLKEERKLKSKTKKTLGAVMTDRRRQEKLTPAVRGGAEGGGAGFALLDRARSEELLACPSPSTTSAAPPPADHSACLHKVSEMESTISDLVKNNELKKQEIAALRMEINRLKEALREKTSPTVSSRSATLIESSITEESETRQLECLVESLTAENTLLREHLQQMGVTLDSSPLSDQQKEMLLRVAQQPPGGSDSIGCAAEWDAKSSSSISEISVACLQGRIQQMEETHYSTNEELQATLQELDDLKEQLAESHAEVQQLQEEKQVILESLTQQTEKLNEARGYNDTLKSMLIEHSENSEDLSQCEKAQRLMELLKSVQEDRELINVKQEELEEQLLAGREAEEHYHRETRLIRDRMKLLETMVEEATNEKKTIEGEVLETKEALKASENEITRLKTSLLSAKEKICELEGAVISGEKSGLVDVLESVRQEKDALEKEGTSLHSKLNVIVCENERLKDQLSAIQDDLRVTRNNAKTNLDDIEYRRSQLEEKRRDLEQEAESLRATVSELQNTCQRHLEDKRDLKANLSEAQKKVNEVLERQNEAERAFSEERSYFNKQVEEWHQFESDLLTTVRVANDFKTEAQHDLEKLQLENQSLRDKLKSLEMDLDKAKVTMKFVPSSTASSSSVGATFTGNDKRLFRSVSHMPNGGTILTDRRANPRPLERGDSRVKSLIVSIESATKQARANSRSSSTSSLASTSSETNMNNNKNITSCIKRSETDGMLRTLTISKDTLVPATPLRTINCNTLTTDPLLGTPPKTPSSNSNLPDNVKITQQLSNEKVNAVNVAKLNGILNSSDQPNNKTVSILANKIEPVRKNSYGQIGCITEKKDPLAALAQSGGSKRNALLKWCQMKTVGYSHVDITNFSSSWNDGMALCAILDTYLPDRINYPSLNPNAKKKNFEIAIMAAESVGILTTIDITSMLTMERPGWQMVFNYVTSIYCHFET